MIDPKEFNINPEDIHISVYRAEHQPKTSAWVVGGMNAGVLLLHKPTGISTKCEKHRSQHRNKSVALEELITLLQDKEKIPLRLCRDVNHHPFGTTPCTRYYVYDARDCDLDGYDYLVQDSESFDEPVSAFLNKEMAEDYCLYLNKRETTL